MNFSPQSRHQSRELALQILFQFEFISESEFQSSFQRFISNFAPPEHVVEYCEKLVFGVMSNRENIDATIQKFSPHWKLSRMDKVDRNTLRIAAYELIYENTEVPPKVVINEAVEIGKVYGNADSAAFINGILDKLARNNQFLEN